MCCMTLDFYFRYSSQCYHPIMRIRKLSALFWSTCILALIVILYVTTDLSFKLPSIRPAYQEVDEVSAVINTIIIFI